jgi:hypothetical protein
VDLVLSNVGVSKDFLHWGNTFLEHGNTEFLELSSSDGTIEVLVFSKGINFDCSLGGRGENSLCSFTLSPESSDTPGISSDINSLLLEEISTTVLNKLIIEVFTSQMCVSSSSLNLKDTIFDCKE